MHPHAQLIEQFYKAFQERNAAGMIACYHDQITFNDPVFVNLQGDRAKAMWQMLCERGQDLKVVFSDIEADDRTGKAHWEAFYTFSRSGNKVHNIIDAQFRFQDGKIIDHRDQFNFWRWSSQALGTSGKLLGWTPFFHKAVQKQTIQVLDSYIAKRESS